jgi:osmotically-inducible protein OsmY
MLKVFRNVITIIIVAVILYIGYVVFIEKKSLSEILEVGKETVADKSLELKVTSQISFNKNLKDSDIKVEAEEGIITLTGTVNSSKKAVLAAQIADSVDGVERVINKIKVSTELDELSSDGRSEREKLLDEELQKKADAIFTTTDELSGSNIKVIAFKRVLFLEGTVKTEEQKDLAVKLARKIDRVIDVQEDLKRDFE